MKQDIAKKIESLREEIRRHDRLYYVLSKPEIADKEYDDLLRRLTLLEEAHPKFKSPDSPAARLTGGILSGFRTLRHRKKMLSLENTYSVEELMEWDARVRKGLKKDACEYAVELKIDGVSANVTYERGRLACAATRGDGETGEDVTHNVRTIRALPLVLGGKGWPSIIEVRGEVYMERADFDALNRERERAGEQLFANPRNAASGSLKQLDPAVTARRRLTFFAHSLGECADAGFRTQWEYLNALREWGVRTNPHARLCPTIEDVLGYCDQWQRRRDTLAYEIDGIVVKVNAIRDQEKLGWTLKSPRWAVAFKFPARQATTEVVRITVNVGRTGVITPTAELKPVECGGVVIRNATLHNFDEIRRLDIKEGDRVLIERAGDVIPKVVKVVSDGGGKQFSVPRACPVCAGTVVKEKEEDVAYRCINPSCPAQLERALLHFGSRAAMDIEGLGEAVVAQLVAMKLVAGIPDIYRLEEKDLLRLELFKEKKARKLLGQIEASKRRPLSRVLFGLGIRHVGEKAAYVLARRFRTVDELADAAYETLDSIPEIGPVLARTIHDFFSQKSSRALVAALKHAGLNLSEQPQRVKDTPLSGKTVVFTGELVRLSRREAEDRLRRAGGNPSSGVSSKTDYLVAGVSAGSKLAKAKKLGIRIITEDEFEEMAQ